MRSKDGIHCWQDHKKRSRKVLPNMMILSRHDSVGLLSLHEKSCSMCAILRYGTAKGSFPLRFSANLCVSALNPLLSVFIYVLTTDGADYSQNRRNGQKNGRQKDEENPHFSVLHVSVLIPSRGRFPQISSESAFSLRFSANLCVSALNPWFYGWFGTENAIDAVGFAVTGIGLRTAK